MYAEFQAKHPGMALDGPNALDTFEIWSDGYVSGMERTIELYDSHVVAPKLAAEMIQDKPTYSGNLVDSLTGKVERCENGGLLVQKEDQREI